MRQDGEQFFLKGATDFAFKITDRRFAIWNIFELSWIVARAIIEIRKVTSLPIERPFGILIGKLDCLALRTIIEIPLVTGLTFQKRNWHAENQFIGSRNSLSFILQTRRFSPSLSLFPLSLFLLLMQTIGKNWWHRFSRI